MREIPSNKGLTQAADLPGDVLSRRRFTKAQWDASMANFAKLDNTADMRSELSRAREYYRAARGSMQEPWRLAIAAGLDLLESLANLRPAIRTVVAADLRQRIDKHLKEGD